MSEKPPTNLIASVQQQNTLAQAIRNTFARRQTKIPLGTPVALTAGFGLDSEKARLWKAFLNRNRLDVEDDQGLAEVIEEIKQFLSPPLAALARRQSFQGTWSGGGPWRRG